LLCCRIAHLRHLRALWCTDWGVLLLFLAVAFVLDA
jgi:hypothetical protein